jgi:hypothetical protein
LCGRNQGECRWLLRQSLDLIKQWCGSTGDLRRRPLHNRRLHGHRVRALTHGRLDLPLLRWLRLRLLAVSAALGELEKARNLRPQPLHLHGLLILVRGDLHEDLGGLFLQFFQVVLSLWLRRSDLPWLRRLGGSHWRFVLIGGTAFHVCK